MKGGRAEGRKGGRAGGRYVKMWCWLSASFCCRIHSIIVSIRWTGLAPWEFEFPFPVVPPVFCVRLFLLPCKKERHRVLYWRSTGQEPLQSPRRFHNANTYNLNLVSNKITTRLLEYCQFRSSCIVNFHRTESRARSTGIRVDRFFRSTVGKKKSFSGRRVDRLKPARLTTPGRPAWVDRGPAGPAA